MFLFMLLFVLLCFYLCFVLRAIDDAPAESLYTVRDTAAWVLGGEYTHE